MSLYRPPTDRHGHPWTGQAAVTTCDDIYAPQSPPQNVPSGLVDQAAEMAASATSEIAAARLEVRKVCDRLIGCQPGENEASGKLGVPIGDGVGHQLIGNLNALHREIAELRSEILRLSAL